MIKLIQSDRFTEWKKSIRDRRVRAAVAQRTARLELGNLGDSKSAGDGVYEIRIHLGPGYRIYFCWRGRDIVILLVGGEKSDQRRDLDTAKAMKKELDQE
jgi:putative addiction module killer protein